MTEAGPVYILCLACESAIRELSDSPCPNCHRCAFCGQKLKNQDHCTCGYGQDPKKVSWFKEKHGIPEKEIPRERRRLEIRKQLESKQGIATVFFAVPWLFIGPLIRDLFGPITVANLAAMVIGTGVVFMISWWGVHRVFRRIENRRLEAEFPANAQL
jgi:hypothetical protein